MVVTSYLKHLTHCVASQCVTDVVGLHLLCYRDLQSQSA